MRRRNFIRTASAAAASIVIVPAMSCKRVDPKTGLILYTVRGEMTNNPEGTLDRVAEMGYNWIEAADYSGGLFYQMKPGELRTMVESRGMSLISSHNDFNEESYQTHLYDAAEAGLKYIILPSLPHRAISSLDGIKRAADLLNKAGLKGKELGIRVGFHNHWVEFRELEGEVPYDILLNNTDPDLVIFEMDLAWITSGGASPVEYFERYPGRFELLHIKDLSEEKKEATLGEGIIDFSPIFDKLAVAGTKYSFIEQDNPTTHTPLESIEISRNYLINQVL